MERMKGLFVVVLLAAGCWTGAARAQTASELLQEGLYAEEVDGNLDAAIALYGRVTNATDASRSQKAQALYRQGLCYLKKQDEVQAKAVFQTLVADYGDQTRIINEVKPLLEELNNSDPASLMPAKTLAYVELGSPGKQIETLLDMFKGTPLENPLAAIAEGNNNTTGGQSPGNIMAALLNPSMMAEFKKIRGMGVGIVDLPDMQGGDPSLIIVLYPGKSDALRGILLAGLGMVAQPGEMLEGMQTMVFPHESGGAAYDETTIILTSPSAYKAGLLNWCIRQHKGLVQEPTLASDNASFIKMSKKERQERALTFWINVDAGYERLTQLFPEGRLPNELHIVNGLVDFQHIDDVIGSYMLKPDGDTIEVNVSFMEGHHCTAYDLIRTPNLSKAGFEAAPSEAIALVSFALGEAGGVQAQAVTEKLSNLTGLDIGREIFANIEQVTLFVLPQDVASPSMDSPLPPIAQCIGLAVTSRNPQQTRELLTKLLNLTNQADQNAQPPVNGRFRIAQINDQQIYASLNQVNKTTVLSLSSSVTQAAVAAARTNRSVLTGGPLNGAVTTLSPNTSKLVLVNVGGAAKLAGQTIPFGGDEATSELPALYEQLGQACAKTMLQIHTQETPNHLTFRSDMSGLPPINTVFEPMMKLVQAMQSMKSSDSQWSQGPKVHAVVSQTTQAPKIDGNVDNGWMAAKSYTLKNKMYQTPDSDMDCSAGYKVLYDQDNLYVLVQVKDDDFQNDSDEYWEDDAVEVFIDADNRKSSSYDGNDYRYYFGWDATSPTMGEAQHERTTGIQFAFAKTDNGYNVEIKFPWRTLGVTEAAGSAIGLDIQVSDDDGGGLRDSKIAWSAQEDNAWQVPAVFGTAHLAGMVGRWTFDGNAEDSSGHGYHGKIHGDPQWVDGRVGGALKLDGQDDYVETNNTTDLPTWTISVWTKSPAVPSDEMPSGPINREKNYQINWNHVNEPFRGATGVEVNGVWHGTGFGTLEADTWYHLTATYDGEVLIAYKDGVRTSTIGISGTPSHESQPLLFGRNTFVDRNFRGVVDDARVYNYAMSDDEVKTLYQKSQ